MIELLRSFTSPFQTWSFDSHNLFSIYYRNTGFTVTWESIWNPIVFTFWTLAFTSSMIVKNNILTLHPFNMLEFTYTFCYGFKTISNFLAINIRICKISQILLHNLKLKASKMSGDIFSKTRDRSIKGLMSNIQLSSDLKTIWSSREWRCLDIGGCIFNKFFID